MLRRKKAEPKTPHFLSLNQDIVADAQNQKCGLKYVNSQKTSAGFDFNDTLNPHIRFTFR